MSRQELRSTGGNCQGDDRQESCSSAGNCQADDFDSVDGAEGEHHHLFTCDTPTPVFLHLLQHLKKNDHQILQLLSCRHNDVFLRYFKEGVQRLAVREIDAAATVSPLPRDFHLNHIAATFAETVRWWVECDGLSTEPEIIYQHFLTAAQIHDAKEAGQ